MRILRKHDAEIEKHAGYGCIKCAACAEEIIRGEHGGYGGMALPADDVRAAREHYKKMFRNFAWPGGYTVLFTTDDGDVFCGECAEKYFILENEDVTADIYYEGPTVQCDGCGREIESSYGDPDAEEENNDE